MWFEALTGFREDDVDGDAEQIGQLPFESDEIEQPDAVVEIHEQVDVAGFDVVASRRTAEHPHVAGLAGFGGFDDGVAPLSEPSPEQRVGQPQDTVSRWSRLLDDPAKSMRLAVEGDSDVSAPGRGSPLSDVFCVTET